MVTRLNNLSVRTLLIAMLILSITYATPRSEPVEQSKTDVSEEIVTNETPGTKFIREMCGLGTSIILAEPELSLIPEIEKSYQELILQSSSGPDSGPDYVTIVIIAALVLLLLYLVTYDYGNYGGLTKK